MTERKAIQTITPNYSLYECLSIFEKNKFRHLPVITLDPKTKEEIVLAVISQRDLIDEFRRFHSSNLKYVENFIDFPVW